MGADKLKALFQESLAVAARTDAMKPSDLARVVIDATAASEVTREAAKLEHQAAVEIQPNSIRSRFTPWVRHGPPRSMQGKMLIRPHRNSVRYPVNAGI